MPFLCVIFQSFSCHSALRLSFLQSFLCHSVIALHSSVLRCFQFIGRVLACVARLWGASNLKMRARALGRARVARRAAGAGAGQTRRVRTGGGAAGSGAGLGEPRPGEAGLGPAV